MRGNDVARLQTALISQGFLSNGLVTGYFGTMTFFATKRFQASRGIPPTGFVGEMTRSALNQIGCSGPIIPPMPPVISSPEIISISPSSGPFGTTVTLYGRNFSTSAINSINFAGTQNVRTGLSSYNGTTLQFTIPATPCPQGGYVCAQVALAPGNYPISVSNNGGTSNTVWFLVTDQYVTQDRAPSINGVEGPTTLVTGQQGTWTVRATDPYSGNLTYSVTWGDENVTNANAAAAYTSYGQSASFTHAYYNAGTYTPRFTVRNSRGLEAVSTMTVVVGTNSGGTSSQYVTLGLNQTGSIGTIEVTPVAIVEDSRCPANVNCIQAGRVVVATTIRSLYGHRTISLHSNGDIFTAEDGYKVQITDVTPQKFSTGSISDSQYRITYKIWR